MRFMFFCIPAHGHHNPMLPVARELVRRGHAVRFYSFEEFREKVEATGAAYVGCDAYLPPVSDKQMASLRRVSATEMTVQDFRIAERMDPMLADEVGAFAPDGIVTDSVCFWGKLTAMKHGLPMVCSTSTFAFNRASSKYLQNSPAELVDLIFGLPRVQRAAARLRRLGYPVKSALALVRNDNETDTIVYASRSFQPCAETFSAHYAFVGPSIENAPVPKRGRTRKRVYVSLGTVVNQNNAFYRACIDALDGMDVDATLSVGRETDVSALGALPPNVAAYPYVDQLAVLAESDCFVSHCGMNSVSESLYLGVPLVLCPQTGEERAVARRVAEVGAGLPPTDASAEGLRAAVTAVLAGAAYREAAEKMRADFLACSGPAGAADFIEHTGASANDKFLC